MQRTVRRLARSDRGAVAPAVGLSLFALIAAGGIAFDYARMASLDTELQNAADQAALAAAGQLDGEVDACARAAAAAAGLLSNQTLHANDATASRAINVQNESACDATGVIRFYQSYDQVNDTFGPAATTDAEARIVAVQVDPREAVYALTPVVGAFRSGNLRAEAVAALGSAMCKVPPVMMCNPAEPEDNEDLNYDFNPNRGDGLRLVIDAPDAPGNFGFLRIDEAGAKEVAMQLGYDNPPHGCISTSGVETQPGDMQAVRAAFNTRFDISENGAFTCPNSGTCSPSRNSRKDLVKTAGTGGNGCTLSNQGWRESPNPYRGRADAQPLSAATPMNATRVYPDTIGYPRDLCHAMSVDGNCEPSTGNAIIGNGDWDIDAYFQVHYNKDRNWWMANVTDEDGNQLATIPADVPNVSRYDIYQWELRNKSTTIDVDQTIAGTTPAQRNYGRPICRGAGIEPDATTADRRRISVAVVNCEAQEVGGHEKDIEVRKWLDVFLVTPAAARGNGPTAVSTNGDIYVEVIGVAASGGSSENLPQRRDVPYLIR